MYPEIESWKEFYEELDPDRRKALYEEGLKKLEDDGANAFRAELMKLRYTDPRNASHRVDNFLWQMVILPGFLRPIYFFKPVGEREVRAVIRELSRVRLCDPMNCNMPGLRVHHQLLEFTQTHIH